jgi:multicomponent Na+:H+ antiporter subunit F
MTGFEQIAFALLLVGSWMCLFRIAKGPSAPDRTVAIDILGTLMVGFCCILALQTQQEYYMNIAIAWALISFVGTLALAKYLEGRPYDA